MCVICRCFGSTLLRIHGRRDYSGWYVTFVYMCTQCIWIHIKPGRIYEQIKYQLYHVCIQLLCYRIELLSCVYVYSICFVLLTYQCFVVCIRLFLFLFLSFCSLFRPCCYVACRLFMHKYCVSCHVSRCVSFWYMCLAWHRHQYSLDIIYYCIYPQI